MKKILFLFVILAALLPFGSFVRGEGSGCICGGTASLNDLGQLVLPSTGVTEADIQGSCEILGGAYISFSCSNAQIYVDDIEQERCSTSQIKQSLLDEFGIPAVAAFAVEENISCAWAQIPANIYKTSMGGSSGSPTERFYCDCSASQYSDFPQKVNGKTCDVFNTVEELEKDGTPCPTECDRLGPLTTPPAACKMDVVEKSGENVNPDYNPSATVPDKTVKLNNPLESGGTDISAIIGNIIKTAMGVMGALVLLMIVWGGFTWLTAAGNPEKVKSGSNTIMWAVLGSVVVLGSYFLLTTVLKALAG